MRFSELIKNILEGEKITRLEWQTEEAYCYIDNNYLCIKHPGDDKVHQWILTVEDLEATDWDYIDNNP